MSQRMFESCIDACHLCANACDHCAVSCLAEADVARMARCIAVDVDCAQICRLAAGFMARGSESAAAVCRACVDACNACADECARHAMQHCQDCALAWGGGGGGGGGRGGGGGGGGGGRRVDVSVRSFGSMRVC
ncbi:putative membrane protein YgcG, partial [Janthinobacterium sp. CG_23.3]|uniref:four-helix bundle copper-binding protein n=1 Tax=Janthinobacterium sp. CG_23.3 TaxID=3349634 RepID=UPI0038D4AB3B